MTFLSQASSQNKSLCRGRQNLLQAIASHPEKWNLKQLSLCLGRNHAYLHQYVYRGSPRALPEQIRRRLARLLRVNEARLRSGSGSDFSTSHEWDTTGPDEISGDLITIEYVDHPSQMKFAGTPWHIPASVLKKNSSAPSQMMRLAVIDEGTADFIFRQGDVVILDTADTRPLRAGYFAIDTGENIRVRHIEQNTSGPAALLHIGQNGDAFYEIPEDRINIMGRVIFHSRLVEM